MNCDKKQYKPKKELRQKRKIISEKEIISENMKKDEIKEKDEFVNFDQKASIKKANKKRKNLINGLLSLLITIGFIAGIIWLVTFLGVSGIDIFAFFMVLMFFGAIGSIFS